MASNLILGFTPNDGLEYKLSIFLCCMNLFVVLIYCMKRDSVYPIRDVERDLVLGDTNFSKEQHSASRRPTSLRLFCRGILFDVARPDQHH